MHHMKMTRFIVITLLLHVLINVICVTGQTEEPFPRQDHSFLRRFRNAASRGINTSRDFGSHFFNSGMSALSRFGTSRSPSETGIFSRSSIGRRTSPTLANSQPSRVSMSPSPPPFSAITRFPEMFNETGYVHSCDCRTYVPSPIPLSTTTPNPQLGSTSSSSSTTTVTPSSFTPNLSPSNSRIDDSIDTRIVNGSKADSNAHPYLVSLGRGINDKYTNNSHYCGGTLVNSRWVLTAAHCVSDYKPKKLLIAGGSSDRQKMRVVVESNNVYVHPHYSGWPEYANDIALVELPQDLRISSYLRPACMHLTKLSVHGNLVGVGWGQLAYSGNYPRDLQKVNFNFVPYYECKKSWEKESSHPPVTRQHLCVHNINSDICGGDSGSPLVYQVDGRDYIVGVASFTNYCDKTQPAVYVRLYSYIPWILSVIRDHCI